MPGSFVRLARGYVHYELLGSEDRPVIVLVPGLSVPFSTWDRNASVLASRGYRVLRYDHYGRGYSDRPRAVYDLELFVEQLAELMPALGLTLPVFLVGLSMGGPVAAAAATMHPGLASGLALIDPLYEWPKQSLAMRVALSAFSRRRDHGASRREIPGERAAGGFFRCSFYEEFIPSYMPAFRYHGIERAVLATMRSIPSWPLKRNFEALGRSGLPVLLFWGCEDATLPFEQSARLLGCLPGAEFHIVEGAGHVPHWEKAEEVNEALLEFLHRAMSM